FASEVFGPRVLLLLDFINWFSQIQILFWAVGAFVCVRQVAAYYGHARHMAPDERTAPRAAMLPYLTCLLWQLIPIAFLCFFTFHGRPGDPPPIVPIRYYLISYPMP